jgi:hypothetical protein
MFKTLSALILTVSLTCLVPSFVYAEAIYPSDEGIVSSVIDTEGYTYMELENGDEKFWIAAPSTKAVKGDHIRFVESMRMRNFTSKTLNRTFYEVIFVTSTQVKVKQ